MRHHRLSHRVPLLLAPAVLVAAALPGVSARAAGARAAGARAAGLAGPVRWSVTADEAVRGESLSAVACGVPQSCVVLGDDASGGLAGEIEDGAVSALQRSPLAVALTCRPLGCVSVGGSPYGFRAARLTASGWVRMPLTGPPSLYGEALISVACSATRDCFAVGNSDTRTDVGCPTPDPAGRLCDTSLPVLERWRGRGWSAAAGPPVPVTAVTAVPVASAEPLSTFNGVACTSHGCVVIGEVWSGTTVTQAFSDTLTGGGWVLAMMPLPAMASTASLSSVSCAPDRCMAVGSATINGVILPLAMEQRRGRWSDVSPPASGTAALTSVSCLASGACLAVGSSGTGKRQVPLIERWDAAGHWLRAVAVAPRNSRARGGSALVSVSCASRTCTAVGNYTGTTRLGSPLGWFVEHGPI